MPNAKSISSYPAALQLIAENAPRLKEAFVALETDEKSAHAFRGQWYSFIKALERQYGPESLEVHHARGLCVSLKKNGERTQVIFTPRSQTLFAAQAEEAFTRMQNHFREEVPRGGEGLSLQEQARLVAEQMATEEFNEQGGVAGLFARYEETGGELAEYKTEDDPSH